MTEALKNFFAKNVGAYGAVPLMMSRFKMIDWSGHVRHSNSLEVLASVYKTLQRVRSRIVQTSERTVAVQLAWVIWNWSNLV